MKRIIILLSLFLATVCFGQEAIEEDKFFEINNFSPMLNSHMNEYLLKANSAVEAFNVRANKKVGSLAKRPTMVKYGTSGSSSVRGLHRFYKSDGTKHLIIFSGTNVYRDSTGTQIGQGFTDGKYWDCVTYKDDAICTNGTEQPIKYDGHTATGTADGDRTASDLVAELGGVYAEINTGTDLDASSWYQYKMQCTDGSVNWYNNAKSNALLTGASDHNITVTVPLCPSGTTSRMIYRTEGQSSRANLSSATYKLAHTIADNTTTTWDDNVADGSLTTTWSTTGKVSLTPPISKYILINKDRLFLANDSTTSYGKSAIYWSYALKPNLFATADDYEFITPDDGDEIQGIENHLGMFVVLKKKSISKLYTNNSNTDNWTVSAPFSHVGAIASKSIVVTPKGIFYLGHDGIYSFNGNNSTLISDNVTDVVRDVLESAYNDVVSYFFKNTYYLAYTSKTTGAGKNDRVLLLDTTRNAYVIDSKAMSSFVAFDSGDDFGVLYGGSSSDGSVYAFDESLDNLIYRYKSELDAGTKTYVSTGGTETNPYMVKAWNLGLDDAAFAGKTLDDAFFVGDTIAQPTDDGVWVSPAIEVNAGSFSKMYWGEELNTYGDVVFSIRTAATEAGLSSASYTGSFTNPSGSDISSVTANVWMQIRATLSTTNVNYSPKVKLDDNYVIKIIYSKSGTNKETSIASIWKNALFDMNVPNYPKIVNEMQIFYEGTSGTLQINVKDSDNKIDQTISIDLSVDPTSNATDNYYGTNSAKIYRYIPNFVDNIIGREFKLTVTETGITEWKINKILFNFDVYPYTTFR